jgi:hypothetical protein
MHKSEEVRELASAWSEDDPKLHGMLLSYAALLEAMEKMLAEEPIEMALVVNEIKRKAEEILRRKG